MELLELVSLFRQLCERLELDKKQMAEDQQSLANVLERAKMRLCAQKVSGILKLKIERKFKN